MKTLATKTCLLLIFSFFQQAIFAQKGAIFAIEEAYIEVLAQKYKGIIQSKVKANIMIDSTHVKHHTLYVFNDLALVMGLINFTGSNKEYYDIQETFNYATVYLKHEKRWYLFSWFQKHKYSTYHKNW